MTRNVDDVHAYDSGFIKAMQRLDELDTCDHNTELIKDFIMDCRREDLAKSTMTNYLNLLKRMVERLEEIGYLKPLDELKQNDFDMLMIHLEDVRGISKGEIRNYKKVTKKFFKFLYDDDIPAWVRKIKLGTIETHVQPQDLPETEAIQRMIGVCTNARNRALVATLFDGGFRPGALLSCRVGGVQSNQYGSIIYLSKSSRSRKTTPAKGIPLTWSSGYLQQWLAVHPFKDDPDAPLWVTLDKNHEPLSYKTFRVTIKKIAKDAGIEKRFYPYLFRHKAVTDWILQGFNAQAINHRAGWSKDSTRMYKVYGNFTDQEMNDSIYEAYGLKTDEKKQVTLKNCPRCNNILKPTDKFCSQCSLVLDHEALEQIQVHEKVTPKLIEALAKSDVGRELLASLQ